MKKIIFYSKGVVCSVKKLSFISGSEIIINKNELQMNFRKKGNK
jgi:hypothetical protein